MRPRPHQHPELRSIHLGERQRYNGVLEEVDDDSTPGARHGPPGGVRGGRVGGDARQGDGRHRPGRVRHLRSVPAAAGPSTARPGERTPANFSNSIFRATAEK